jgi:ankyrin repeat protein
LEQSNLQGSSRRDVLYALSGSYLNDSVIQYDAERGLQHLSKAAAEGHEDALFMKRDVFEAATGIPHPEFKDEIAETICEAAKMQMATSIIVMSYLKLQDFKQHHWQFSKCYSWRRHFPVEYKEYTYSAERARYMAVALQTCLDTDSNQEAWITDSESESSTSLEETSKFLFTTDWFDAPVMDGLTRLQTVAILEPLFEADLASYLVEKSGADLNACGTMPGWTPLWLSILCGHSRTTQYLLRNGASLTYVGPGSAGSVLHILNQLDASEAPAVLTNILAANDADKQSDLELRVGGLTPLQATFVGWDFSDGAAARALLDEGANPTSRAGLEQGNVTPIALCMRSLNYKLLSNMLASRWVLDNNNQPAARTALASAKASAFTTLLNHTKFYYMSVLGRDFEQSLTNCLKLLIDDDMKIQLGLRNTDPNVPGDPLATALYTSRAYVAEALLREFPLTAFVSAAFSRPYIQIAIKRRLRKCVMSLISKGANLLQKGMDNSTSLHAAAQYFPEILLDLIEILDEIPLSRRQGMTMKEILVMKNIDGFDVVSLLLLEGHREELNIVEQLRTQYALDLYSFRYAVGESQCTLAGICTLMTARTGLVSLSQLEYLLKLEPPPSFVCSDDGSTLLTLAALSGPSGSKYNAPLLHPHFSSTT